MTNNLQAYEIIARSAAVVFLWKNERGWPVEFVSRNVLNIFGFSDHDFISGAISYESLIHPKDLERVLQEVVNASNNQILTQFEHAPYRIITQKGEIRWVKDNTCIRRDDNGHVLHYEGIILDITEELEAKKRLEKNLEVERIISAVAKKFSNGSVGYDQLINEALSSISDWAKVDRGKLFIIEDGHAFNTHEWLAPGIESNQEKCQHIPMSGFPWWEMQMRNHDIISLNDLELLPQRDAINEKELFESFDLKAILAIPLSYAKKPFGFLTFDVAKTREWKDYEQKLLKMTGDLFINIVRNETNRIEKEKLQQRLLVSSKLASVGELASGVAHEINSPLTIILHNLKKLLNENETLPLKKTLKAAEKIRDIVKDLKQFAKPSYHHSEVCDLHESLLQAISLIRKNYSDQGIEIDLQLDADRSLCKINVERFQQAFLNILSNANDAISTKDGSIQIKTSNTGNNLIIDVIDNGDGIDPKNLSKIFDVFFTTKEHVTRAGLGLGISRSIINEFNGEITVESQMGSGSNFTLTIPCT